ncbi:MAG: penicillin-binding protein 2 [Bacteroidota bacterium]|jgi:penicillin-binding protein 2
MSNTSGRNQQVVVAGIFTSLIVIFIIRLFYVQIIEESYTVSANNNVLRYMTDYPARGMVYDRNGKILAFNQAVYDLMVIPRQVKELDTLDFCKLLDISKEDFLEKFKKAKNYSRIRPSIFEKQISAETYATLQEKLFKFKGFYVQPRTIRKYPNNTASHVLGYIGEVTDKVIEKNPYYRQGDYIGTSGIEQSYEEELRGVRGVRIVMVDVFNREKGSYKNGSYDTVAVAGSNLVATLDADLQAYGEKLMANKIGALVAIEPKTGEILSMISSPSYDPNLLVGRARSKNYGYLLKESSKPLFNRAMQAYYPPGSTFKLTNALAALQEGIINPMTTFPHSFVVGSKSVHCHPHPPIALEGAIQYSCNPYFCNTFRAFVDNNKFADSETGYNAWRTYQESFGIGKKIGVDLPHELKGLLPTTTFYDKYYGRHHWKASTIYSLGIGQGELGITPLQMANVMCIIANKGYYYTPHIIKKIAGKVNTTRGLSEKHFTKISETNFTVVQDGMQRVVEAGTARVAQFREVVICGKTGTAQNPHGKDHSLFVGFAPRENPRIAIAVMVENAGYGASWAAPIASLMMEKFMYDSISRPDLEEKMMKGDLINIINNTLEKKPENIDAQIIGPSLKDLLPELELNDWAVVDNELIEKSIDDKKNSNDNSSKNEKPLWLDIFNFNIIIRIEKNEYFC